LHVWKDTGNREKAFLRPEKHAPQTVGRPPRASRHTIGQHIERRGDLPGMDKKHTSCYYDKELSKE
jgi:hypothetical protein